MIPQVFVWSTGERYPNYARAVRQAGGQLCLSARPDRAAGCAALLLPGGGDVEPWRYGRQNTASRGLEPERDAAELYLLERFTAAGKPVLGVCRGMQVINVFFGGTLIQDLPGHSAVQGIDRLHFVRSAPSPLAAACGGSAIVNSAHHQAADRLGSGLRAVQWAPDGTVEALCHTALPLWAVQYHPERAWPPDSGSCVFRAFLRLCR